MIQLFKKWFLKLLFNKKQIKIKKEKEIKCPVIIDNELGNQYDW